MIKIATVFMSLAKQFTCRAEVNYLLDACGVPLIGYEHLELPSSHHQFCFPRFRGGPKSGSI